MLEILSGLVAFLLIMFGIEKYKGVREKAEAAEREEVRTKEALRQKNQATEALVRGMTDEDEAIQNPDSHDFTK
jgi:hypothetical protein